MDGCIDRWIDGCMDGWFKATVCWCFAVFGLYLFFVYLTACSRTIDWRQWGGVNELSISSKQQFFFRQWPGKGPHLTFCYVSLIDQQGMCIRPCLLHFIGFQWEKQSSQDRFVSETLCFQSNIDLAAIHFSSCTLWPYQTCYFLQKWLQLIHSQQCFLCFLLCLSSSCRTLHIC